MAAHKAPPVRLSSEHERELNNLVRAHSTPQKLAERARIILLAAAGLGVEETAHQLGIWRKTAGHWRRRLGNKRTDALLTLHAKRVCYRLVAFDLSKIEGNHELESK